MVQLIARMSGLQFKVYVSVIPRILISLLYSIQLLPMRMRVTLRVFFWA
jgi:hypothetical protein